MPLTVVVGLPGSGGRRHVIDTVARAASTGRSALLVVPSGVQAATVRSNAAATTPVGLRVGTLDGAIRREWALRGDGRVILAPLQGDLLAARALEQAGVGERPGRGAVALLRTLASRHASTGGTVPAGTSGLSGRLLRALMSYEEAVRSHGLLDREEAARLLASDPPPAEAIGLSGFTVFRPAEERLIVSWAETADVVLELPWRESAAGTQPLTPLIERLKAVGATLVDLGGPSDGRSEELCRVATALFAGDPPAATHGSVRLGTARGDEAESALIVRFVAELLESGAVADSIAIAFPDLARHSGWITHALRDAGVPASIDVECLGTETPFGRAILRLWAFVRQGMTREDLAAFLRSPFAGVGLAKADRADALARRKGWHAGSDVLGLAGVAYPLLEECRRLADRPIDPASARIWKDVADTLLSNAYSGAAPVIGSDGLIDAAAHRTFTSLVQQALELGADAPRPDGLMEAFATARVSRPGDSERGSVRVTSLAGLAEGEFDHVVIGGLTASEFPRRGSEERMQGDAVGRVASVLGIAPDPEEHARQERLAFYLAVTAPRRSLALVRRDADDDGTALRESVFWDEFLDLYRSPGAPEWPAAGPRMEKGADSSGRRGARRRARGHLTDDDVLADLAAIAAVSPSAIESYAGCPYRWFVERRLHPEAPDTAFDRLAAGSLAHAALAALQARLAGLGGRVTPENLPRALELARECYETARRSAPVPVGLDEQRLQNDVWPAIERTVRADATFLPGLRPLHAEWSFGLDEADDPIDVGGVVLKGRVDRIDEGPAGLVITDYKLSAAHSLADIEKKGLLQLQLYAAAASARLGRPVLGGVYRSLKTGDARGFVRAGLGDGFKARDVVDGARLAGIIETAVDTARAAVEGMRAGRIEPRPDVERCGYCAAAAFCREAER